jgi:hypothetical protein
MARLASIFRERAEDGGVAAAPAFAEDQVDA